MTEHRQCRSCGMCSNDPRFIQATGEARGHVIPGAPPELCGPLEPVLESRRIRFIFAWYDLWIGAYWDRDARRLYLMVPTVGVSIDFGKGDCR